MGDLLLSQNGTRFVLIRWIANECSVTSDQKSDLMTQILKLTQFAHRDRMAEMQIGGGGVIAAIYAQGTALFLRVDQTLAQFGSHGLLYFFVAIFCAQHEQFNLFLDVHMDLLWNPSAC